MSENKGHLVASIKKIGDRFEAMYEGTTEMFDSFDEANLWMMDQEEQSTDTPELAASETSVEQAEAINSNVNEAPHYPGSTGDIHAEQ